MLHWKRIISRVILGRSRPNEIIYVPNVSLFAMGAHNVACIEAHLS